MEQYNTASYLASRVITDAYSTSFGLSIRLFTTDLRPHIYAIYGFVRIADEIVDTYRGSDAQDQLDSLESDTYQALTTGYSANPIIQAYVVTARRFKIGKRLIKPFFASMRMDLSPQTYAQKSYEAYIHGSAEVVGLMCLKVFLNDEAAYAKLETGAKRLGAAYQKVNFLRDIAADADGLGRWYFPFASYDHFDEATKQVIVNDIQADFDAAKPSIRQLPDSSRRAVLLSYRYYQSLLRKIRRTPAAKLKRSRIRLPDSQKLLLLTTVAVRGK